MKLGLRGAQGRNGTADTVACSIAGRLRDDLRALALQLASGAAPPLAEVRPARSGRLALVVLLALGLAVLGAVGTGWWRRSARERWVRNEALPKLEALVDRIQGLEEGREAWDAFLLARDIEAVSPDEPLLARLRPKFAREIAITSEPPGATVAVRYYDDPGAPPVLLGKTPLAKVAYPRGFTRIELSLPGRRSVEDVIWNLGMIGDRWSYRLHSAGELPEEMAWIPRGSFSLYLPGLEHLKKEPTAAFLMDRDEVTQRDYKRFVDAGGYREAKLWRQPFVEKGRTLSFAEAMARFVDRTGRPGPATWEVGSYPEGGGDLPVGGVSWYEAAAYATWAGKSLPTIFHWNRVAFTVGISHIAPAANLGGKGPVPVGTTRSMNRFGVSNLAGTCASGCGTRARATASGSSSAAAGTTRTTRSWTPTRRRPSTARRRTACVASAVSIRSRTPPPSSASSSCRSATSAPRSPSPTRSSRSISANSPTTRRRSTPRSRRRRRRRPGPGRRSPSARRTAASGCSPTSSCRPAASRRTRSWSPSRVRGRSTSARASRSSSAASTSCRRAAGPSSGRSTRARTSAAATCTPTLRTRRRSTRTTSSCGRRTWRARSTTSRAARTSTPGASPTTA